MGREERRKHAVGGGDAIVHCRVDFWRGILSALHINQKQHKQRGGKEDEEWKVEKDFTGNGDCVCGVNGGDDTMGSYAQEHHSGRPGSAADHEGV